jgi:Mce-associated membrane protein
MSGRRRMSTIVSVVTTALCVPAAVSVVLLAGRTSADSKANAARSGALIAATKIARDILSYDYRTIDRDLARARADSTGAFAAQYAAASAQLRTQALYTHAIVQARVRDAGIVSANSHEATILIFADQVSVTRLMAAQVPRTRLIPSAVQMTLTKSGGHWRVSALSALETGSGAG